MKLTKKKWPSCSWWPDHWSINDELGNEIATIDSYLPGDQQEPLANLFCAAPALFAIAKRFCARVEAGEIRSRDTYRDFLEVIASVEGTTGAAAVRAGMAAGIPLHQIEDALDAAGGDCRP